MEANTRLWGTDCAGFWNSWETFVHLNMKKLLIKKFSTTPENFCLSCLEHQEEEVKDIRVDQADAIGGYSEVIIVFPLHWNWPSNDLQPILKIIWRREKYNALFCDADNKCSSPPLLIQNSLDKIEGIVRVDHVLALHHRRHRLLPAAKLLQVYGLVLLGHRQRDSHWLGSRWGRRRRRGRRGRGKREGEEEKEEESEDSIGRDTGQSQGKACKGGADTVLPKLMHMLLISKEILVSLLLKCLNCPPAFDK